MKLKTSLLLGDLLLGIIVLVVSFTAIYFINRLSSAPDKILNENYGSIVAAQKMIDELDNMDNAIISSVGGAKNRDVIEQIFEKSQSSYYKNLNICAKNITEPGEKELIDTIRTESEEYIDSFKKNEAFLKSISDYDRLVYPFYISLKQKNYELLNLNHKGMLLRRDIAVDTSETAKIYMLIISALSVVIVIIAIIKVPELFTKPIVEFTRKVQAIANKKYSERIDVKSKNELGTLAESFNLMASKLEEYEKSNIDKLIAEKKRAETIVKSMVDGIIVLNEKNEIILVNNTGIELLGLTENELTGKDIYSIAEHNNLVKNLTEDIIYSPEEKNKLNYIRIVFRDKEEFFLKEIIKVTDNENKNRLLGNIVILKNVTGFKELDELKSGFVATVSHELRTPLSAMNMSMRLLQDERIGSMNEEQKKIISTMKEEVKRLLKLVNELLNLSKMESGSEMLKYSPIKAEEIVDAAVTPMLMQLEQKNINLETIIEPGLPELKADANKISWVLINLLNNAVRYSKENGSIILTVKKINNSLQFSVKDFGTGIEPQYVSKIFSKFVQVGSKNVESLSKGVGLGLAISKEFVNAHGGEIWVKSELGKGSEFFFSIPF
jgi:two-component system, NtrC family, sensor histidine kinase KinB